MPPPASAAVYMGTDPWQSEWVHPTRSLETSNAGETETTRSKCASVKGCMCGKRLKEEEGKGRKGKEVTSKMREKNLIPEQGDRELHEVTGPRCGLIIITMISSKWLMPTCVELVSPSFRFTFVG